MSFDPMAAAIDWLDAYRRGDIETVLEMHAPNAVVRCGCDSMKIVSGEEALHAYWRKFIRSHPAFDLEDLQPSDDGIAISYITRSNIVRAVLTFNAAGKIASITCSMERAPYAVARPGDATGIDGPWAA